MRMKSIFVVAFTYAIFFIGCQSNEELAEDRVITVDVVRPKRVDMAVKLDFVGELKAYREAELEFNFTGRIARLSYRVGDSVVEGTVMAALEQEEILANLEQARAAHEKAQSDLRKIERLHAEEIASDDRLEGARLAVKQAHATLVVAQEMLRSSTIVAPFSGQVAVKNGEVGELFNSMAMEPPTYVLVDISRVKVIVGVPEADLSRIKTGQEAWIEVSTYPGRQFHGRVTQVGLVVSRMSRTADVEITVHNPEGLLKPGMMADIHLLVGQLEDVISLPDEAIMKDMGLTHVLVVNDNRIVMREVTVGALQDGIYQIVGGLSGAEQVVREGQYQLKEGDSVRVQE